MKTLYFDCFSGASGNMILGGLISLGVDQNFLKSEIQKLGISEFDLEIHPVDRSGICAMHVETKYPKETHHRHLADIVRIISESTLDKKISNRAIAIFTKLADAEAKVHGIHIEKVHFHEVGAMDAIIDVVGACIGFESLGVERFLCSRIHVGSGFVDMDHGRYPIPPPAVSELLTGYPIYYTGLEGELITPTGAAIIATICDEYQCLSDFRLECNGYGAGTREFEGFPNVLRLMLGDSADGAIETNENLSLLESNLDDCSGEALGYLMDEALSRGALDCWFTPIQMKKNRPATLVSLLCRDSEKDKLKKLLYTETSTIGIRMRNITRECLQREMSVLDSEYGRIDLKISRYEGRVVNVKPEFGQMQEAARTSGVELKKVVTEVTALCAERYEGASIVGSKAFGRSG